VPAFAEAPEPQGCGIGQGLVQGNRLDR
jgi:hypothetical protein